MASQYKVWLEAEEITDVGEEREDYRSASEPVCIFRGDTLAEAEAFMRSLVTAHGMDPDGRDGQGGSVDMLDYGADDNEPTSAQLEAMNNPDSGPSDAAYRDAMRDAGRGGLLA